MLTAIRVGGESLTGICKLKTDTNAAFSQKPQTVEVALSQQVLSRTPTSSLTDCVYSINQVSPNHWDGDFLLLGSMCTSVTDHTDPSDVSMQPSDSNTLIVYDGCFPCNTCSQLAQLQDAIENCQIWINGLKDCNLYYQDASARLWEDMLQKKVQQSDNCAVKNEVLTDRQEEFGRATKLLYQYKAAVAMWNYLVRTKAGHTQILQAPEDYGGFVIQSKRSIDFCGCTSTGLATFSVTVKLTSGQGPAYLSSLNSGIGFYVGKVDQNTYIEYGRDTGMSREQSGHIVMTHSVSQDASDSYPVVNVNFTFNPTKISDTIFSAAVKILPVIYYKDRKYKSTDSQGHIVETTAPSTPVASLSLSNWIAFRPGAVAIDQAEQTQKNRWYINTKWESSQLPQYSDSSTSIEGFFEEDYYYSTAYYKYPVQEESDSGSESI